MLYGFLVSLYVAVCILLVMVIMVQKSKGSVGLGSLGGGAQTLFGGSGGQDVFQKATWMLAAIFMAGSFVLSIMRSRQEVCFRYAHNVPVSSSYPPAQIPSPRNT